MSVVASGSVVGSGSESGGEVLAWAGSTIVCTIGLFRARLRLPQP